MTFDEWWTSMEYLYDKHSGYHRAQEAFDAAVAERDKQANEDFGELRTSIKRVMAQRDKLIEAVRRLRNEYGVRARAADVEARYYMDMGGPGSIEYWVRHERAEVCGRCIERLDAILKEHAKGKP